MRSIGTIVTVCIANYCNVPLGIVRHFEYLLLLLEILPININNLVYNLNSIAYIQYQQWFTISQKYDNILRQSCQIYSVFCHMLCNVLQHITSTNLSKRILVDSFSMQYSLSKLPFPFCCDISMHMFLIIRLMCITQLFCAIQRLLAYGSSCYWT